MKGKTNRGIVIPLALVITVVGGVATYFTTQASTDKRLTTLEVQVENLHEKTDLILDYFQLTPR